MSKLDLGDLFAVLTKNSDDIADIVERFGGVAAVVQAAPSLYRIARTIAARNKVEQDAEKIEHVLYYSDETAGRVRAFQKKHGLDVDGLVGPITWRAIEAALAAK